MENTQRANPVHWYHPELDLLRFCAFCMVFLFHANGGKFGSRFAPGAYGVDLFFALSAYLITEILLREKRTRGEFDIRKFYLRRILRIWPLYFAFLALTFLFARRFLNTEDFPLSAKVMFLLFVGNWQFLLGRQIRTVASLLWSVCVEEQFYLTWPLLLRRWPNGLPWIGAALFGIATVTRLVFYLHGGVTRPVDTYWKGTFTHLDPIVAGSLVAFVLKGKVPRFVWTQRVLLGAAGIAGVLAAGWIGRPDGGRALWSYPLAAISCAAILVSVLRPMRAEKIGRVRALFIHLGRISYGLYVFHVAGLGVAGRIAIPGQPRMEWMVQRIAGFLLTIAAAECSYRVLELPFLRLKDRFSMVRSAPVAPALAAAEAATG